MHEALFKYNWPGNVRELQNVIYRYVALNQFDIIASSEMQDFESDEASKAIANKPGKSLGDQPVAPRKSCCQS